MEDPRDKTLCFMLSENEKRDVDCLAGCMSITRSGLLAKIVSEFVLAATDTERMEESEEELLAYLAECRKAAKLRWKIMESKLAHLEAQKS